MRKALIGIAIATLLIISAFATIQVSGQTSYRSKYGATININFLENKRQQDPNFNPFNFISYTLSQISTKYGITFPYLKLDFDLLSVSDYTQLLNQIDYYVHNFMQTFPTTNFMIQLSVIRQTHQCLNTYQMHSLFYNIAYRINPYYSRIIAFAGENELEGNTTCPICGRAGGEIAFGGSVTAMINYANALYNTWKCYSGIPFTHSSVAPWHHDTNNVYGGFWFGSMPKNTYLNYIASTQDINAWTIWWNTDGAQYLGEVNQILGRQAIVSEHNFHDPNHAIGIMNNFGNRLLAFNWFTLVRDDMQVMYDWGCGEHGLFKYSWFPLAKVPTCSIPEGNYHGVVNTWHDLSLQGYQDAWKAYVSTYVYATKSINIATSGYDAFECYANFEGVATQTGDIEFMTVGTSDGRSYTIGAQIYTDRTFRIFFKYITAGGGSFTVYYNLRDLTYMNTWWRLTMYHARGVIYFMINGDLWLVQGNSDISSRTFTNVIFGDRSSTVASKIYLDHLKLWTSTDGSNWVLRFEERFENNLSGWSKIYSPIPQPSTIDVSNGFFVDYASCYSAHQVP